jgi:hypothetical protein
MQQLYAVRIYHPNNLFQSLFRNGCLFAFVGDLVGALLMGLTTGDCAGVANVDVGADTGMLPAVVGVVGTATGAGVGMGVKTQAPVSTLHVSVVWVFSSVQSSFLKQFMAW